jgi:hypothetical protein
MGVDWLRMRPREGVPLSELEPWVRQLNEARPRGWLSIPIGDEPFAPDEEEARDRRYRQAWDTLQELLELPAKPPGEHFWELKRITDRLDPASPEVRDAEVIRAYVITDNPAFPVEWRLEAYSSFLLPQLQTALSRWRQYIADLGSGHYRGYLFELFHYNNQLLSELPSVVRSLNEELRLSFDRPNAWARKERFLQTRARLLATPVECPIPPFDPLSYPPFNPALRDAGIVAEQLERHQAFLAAHQHIGEKVKAWNRCVPSSRKVAYLQVAYPDFDGFLRQVVEGTWLRCFFRWGEHLTQGGYGLLLWL